MKIRNAFELLEEKDKVDVRGECLAFIALLLWKSGNFKRPEIEKLLGTVTRLELQPDQKKRISWWHSKLDNVYFALRDTGYVGGYVHSVYIPPVHTRIRDGGKRAQSRIRKFAMAYLLSDLDLCKTLASEYISAGCHLPAGFLISFDKSKVEIPIWVSNNEAEAIELAKRRSGEGVKKLVAHFVRERDAGLARMAKSAFAAAHEGKLFCLACGVEPLKVYGVEVIEAHHKIPLSKSEEGRDTSHDDFLMLCPSCHRAVHRIEDCDFNVLKARFV
jgi:hypothetical protein